jgi:hypothetical protein
MNGSPPWGHFVGNHDGCARFLRYNSDVLSDSSEEGAHRYLPGSCETAGVGFRSASRL